MLPSDSREQCVESSNPAWSLVRSPPSSRLPLPQIDEMNNCSSASTFETKLRFESDGSDSLIYHKTRYYSCKGVMSVVLMSIFALIVALHVGIKTTRSLSWTAT